MRRLFPFIRSLARPLPVWLVLPTLFACGTDSLKPVVREEPSDVYWSLALNHQALTMGPRAPYDTITLTATPRNVAGEALTGLPVPTYRSTDITKVTVTPEGFVRVLGSGFEPVWIIATLVSENVRHTDSLRVRSVDVDPPPVLATLSVQPVPPDSAKRGLLTNLTFSAAPGFPPLPVHVADAGGMPLTDVMVSFRSLDSTVSRIDESTGNIAPASIGSVNFTASATMFGIVKTDTVRYRIGLPLNSFVSLGDLSLLIDTISGSIGVGGEVWFSLPTEGTIDFDSADLPNIREAGLTTASHLLGFSTFVCFFADCGSGNVHLARNGVRTFTAPGTYYYHITFADSAGAVRVGRVTVVDER